MVPEPGRPDDGTLHALTLDRPGGTLARVPLTDFTASRAGRLERALRARHIDGVNVRSDRGLPCLSCSCERAMMQLAQLVEEEMPRPHRYAARLGGILRTLGHRHGPPLFASVAPRATDGRVEIGDLTTDQAARLLSLLGHRTPLVHASRRPRCPIPSSH
ncbi:hypothetical protein ACIQNG_34215 [Streptomyces sp. NPDC091377]|uniref:hypothetical protein n=1 Tax=Streptomyces sp. NPDC091377 TaxID=3365995 RepID=UPI003822171A